MLTENSLFTGSDTFDIDLPCTGQLLIRLYLRVLLVKRPDMMEPTFFAQYQFVCNIKSTYQVDTPGTKNLDVGANTVPWGVISVLGPRQK